MLKKNLTSQPKTNAHGEGNHPGFPPVAIIGCGLASLADSSPSALLSMVATRKCGAAADASLTVTNGKTFTEALLAAVPANNGVEYTRDRIKNLSVMALEKTLASLPASVNRADLEIYTTLSARQDAGRLLQEFVEILANQGLKESQFHFISQQDGSVHALAQLCEKSAKKPSQITLFGGADSLIDPSVCMDLAERELLAGQGIPGGVIPGEAAAYLALQAVSKDHDQAIQIKGLSAVESLVPIKHPNCLAHAINQCLEQAAITANDIEAIILPYGQEQSAALEWHHTSQEIWPPLRPHDDEGEQLKVDLLGTDQQPTPLYPSATLGNTGAAGLAISLVLGKARFDFTHQPISRLLICQADDEPFRGALILEQASPKAQPQV